MKTAILEVPGAGNAGGISRMQRNMRFFLGPYLFAIARYQPDFEALNERGCRLVAGVGSESGGQLAHESGLGLAKRLGLDATFFPSGHGGFDSHAAEFAARLTEVLEL